MSIGAVCSLRKKTNCWLVPPGGTPVVFDPCVQLKRAFCVLEKALTNTCVSGGTGVRGMASDRAGAGVWATGIDRVCLGTKRRVLNLLMVMTWSLMAEVLTRPVAR